MFRKLSQPLGDESIWYQRLLDKRSLRYLAGYYAIQSAVLAITLLLFHFSWHFALPQRLFTLFLPLQWLLTLAMFALMVKTQAVKTWHYLALLVISSLLLTWFLHDSGGHTNPLISLLLVPLAISATMLGWQASILLALFVVACYATLMHFFVPLNGMLMGHHHHHMSAVASEQMGQLHLFGMWITFCLSVMLVLVLVLPLVSLLRQQREYIAQQREQALQDEGIVAMATFAAGAAHQLGSPLSTLAVIAADLADDFRDNPQVQGDLRIMGEQISLCKNTLHDMMRRADAIRDHKYEELSITQLVDKLRTAFNLLHPARALQIKSVLPDATLRTDATLEQALLNLLDNAVKAGDQDPQLQVSLVESQQPGKPQQVLLQIIDAGPGFSEDITRRLGEPFISTREQHEGMGLGLFLSNATINRLGGQLKLQTLTQGSVTEVSLPTID